MDEDEIKIDVGLLNHTTTALWVRDFKRSKRFLERFSESAKKILPLKIDELKSILKRKEKRETRYFDFEPIVDEVFIYGPLLIRAENLSRKISETDVRALEKETRLTETENFSFRVDECGVNIYELKGYSHFYPPIKIKLENVESVLEKTFRPKNGRIKRIDFDKKEMLGSLTFELIMQEPMIYAKLHIIREGIIYGEVHTSDRRNAKKISQNLFEGLEKVVYKKE